MTLERGPRQDLPKVYASHAEKLIDTLIERQKKE